MIQIFLSNKNEVIGKHCNFYYNDCKVKLKTALALYRLFNKQLQSGLPLLTTSDLSFLIGTDPVKAAGYLQKVQDSFAEDNLVLENWIRILCVLKGNLKSVLVGEYIELENIISLVQNNLNVYLELHDKRKTYKDIMNPFLQIIKSIFDYDDFIKKKANAIWCGYRLAEDYNINVCPYCNRSYTNTVVNDDHFIIRPEFDHFYKKERYPFFGISLFNLIPSCSICNSVLKGRLDFRPEQNIYPLKEGFENDYIFTTGKTLSDFLDSNIKLDLPIKLVPHPKFDNSDKKDRILANIKAFHLEEIYDKHRDIAEEILFKGRYLKYLDSEIYVRISDKLKSEDTEIDFYRFLLGSYDDSNKFYLRPLSKFTRDIAYEAEIVTIEL